MVRENWEVLKLAAFLWKTPLTIYFSSNIKGTWQTFPNICTLGVGYVCVYLFKHTEVRGWHQVSFWITLHLVFEDSLLLNLELTNLTGLAHQWVPGTLLLLTSSNETIGACDHAQPLSECWDLNSGPRVCTIGTLLTEPTLPLLPKSQDILNDPMALFPKWFYRSLISAKGP